MGCTVFEMFSGKPPWHEIKDQVQAIFHIASSQAPPPFPDRISEEGRDMLNLCFQR